MEGKQEPKPAASTAASTASSTLHSRRRKGKSTPNAPPIPTIRQIRKSCLFNMQYHAAREAFLDSIHRWLMFLVILLGAGAVANAVADNQLAGILVSVASAAIGALDLTFDLSNRARSHAVMRRRYGEILNQCLRNPDGTASADAALVDLAGEEEPVFRALAAVCHNATETQVYGDDQEHLFVPWFHRLLMNFWRFEGAEYGAKSTQNPSP